MNGMLKSSLVTRVSAVATAATSAVNGSVIDMQNFNSALFVASFGTSATDNGIKVQQGDASNLSDAEDIEGSSTLLDGTQTSAVIEIVNPAKRYLRVVAVRGTSTTLESAWAVQYGPNLKPVTSTNAALVAKTLISPEAGTA